MSKKLLILLIVIFTFLSGYFIYQIRQAKNVLYVSQKSQTNNIQTSKKVCIKNNCFEAKVAKTYEELTRGLMFIDHLDNDKGMLFLFTAESKYQFWMKNTLIPLDMIWINKDHQIVFIKENAQPCGQGSCPLITPTQDANYVLEINAGISQKINLAIGDYVSF